MPIASKLLDDFLVWIASKDSLNVLMPDIDMVCDDGMTPLMYAAERGDLATVKLLLQNEADAKIKNQDGANALHFAAAGGHKKIVEFFLNSADSASLLAAADKQGCGFLHYTVFSGDLSQVKKAATMKSGNTSTSSVLGEVVNSGSHIELICCAAQAGSIKVLEYLCREIFNKLKAELGSAISITIANVFDEIMGDETIGDALNPFFRAVKGENSLEVLKCFLSFFKGESLKLLDKHQDFFSNLACNAARLGKEEVVFWILELKGSKGQFLVVPGDQLLLATVEGGSLLLLGKLATLGFAARKNQSFLWPNVCLSVIDGSLYANVVAVGTPLTLCQIAAYHGHGRVLDYLMGCFVNYNRETKEALIAADDYRALMLAAKGGRTDLFKNNLLSNLGKVPRKVVCRLFAEGLEAFALAVIVEPQKMDACSGKAAVELFVHAIAGGCQQSTLEFLFDHFKLGVDLLSKCRFSIATVSEEVTALTCAVVHKNLAAVRWLVDCIGVGEDQVGFVLNLLKYGHEEFVFQYRMSSEIILGAIEQLMNDKNYTQAAVLVAHSQMPVFSAQGRVKELVKHAIGEGSSPCNKAILGRLLQYSKGEVLGFFFDSCREHLRGFASYRTQHFCQWLEQDVKELFNPPSAGDSQYAYSVEGDAREAVVFGLSAHGFGGLFAPSAFFPAVRLRATVLPNSMPNAQNMQHAFAQVCRLAILNMVCCIKRRQKQTLDSAEKHPGLPVELWQFIFDENLLGPFCFELEAQQQSKGRAQLPGPSQ